jgi:hypothetical protein
MRDLQERFWLHFGVLTAIAQLMLSRSGRGVHPAAHPPRLSTAAAHPAREPHSERAATNRSSESRVSVGRRLVDELLDKPGRRTVAVR